ncbi:hypothetical protein U8V72_14320 [Priestia filamentosa]|uniref:hypothetical protein n=1 Tax=Priestia filamentosa TaxID=1402861 RepID=UPI0039786632
MTLEHDFYLVKADIEPKEFVSRYLKGKLELETSEYVADKVHIEDSIILYMQNTLDWIPTRNPGKRSNPKQHGLCYAGITLFDKESAPKLFQIATSWINLYKSAPETFKLPFEDEEESIIYSKSEFLFKLEKLREYANKIAHERFYMYHFGI